MEPLALKRITHKVPGGKLLRISMDIEDGIIKSIKITGDFFLYPEESIEVLEKSLQGATLESVEEILNSKVEEIGIKMVGVSVKDIVGAIRS